MRVAARHHGFARPQERTERLSEFERELRRDLDIRQPVTPSAPNSEPGHLMP